MQFPGRFFALAVLAFTLGTGRAEAFADETWHSLFLTTLLAERVGEDCTGADPALGPALATALARLRAAHGEALQAGRRVAEQRAAPGGVEVAGEAVAGRFRQLLQREDEAARRTRCARLVAQLATSARRTRAELAEPAFRRWFEQQQRERNVDCARLDGAARGLARRLLAGSAAPELREQLRADAKVAERAADWCLQAQALAAREGIEVPGNFGLMRETARAISDAALPLLSGRDPAAALALGRDRARRYLAEPDWL